MISSEIKTAIITCVGNKKLYYNNSFIFSKENKGKFDVYYFNGQSGIYGLRFLTRLFETENIKDYDVVVISDEDNIILNYENIKELIIDFYESGETFRGCRDGGDLEIRSNSPIMINTFFSFYNVVKILKDFNKNKILDCNNFKHSDYENWKIKYKYQGINPFNLMRFSENYYSFYLYYLRLGHKVGFLDVDVDYSDKISTKVYFNNKLISVHTWYSRRYTDSHFHRKRIDNFLNEYCKYRASFSGLFKVKIISKKRINNRLKLIFVLFSEKLNLILNFGYYKMKSLF